MEERHPNDTKTPKVSTQCPYIKTVRRHLLDFDFEKVCCISLSKVNIYACLVCGKYYQGRGKDTYAYIHSLEEEHQMFINLHDQKIFCLPDGYEVIDSSLDDIKDNLNPKFTIEEIKRLDLNTSLTRTIFGTSYLPGCVGLNNIKQTDYVNVIIQALSKISSLRDYFLQYDKEVELKNDLSGVLMQRMCEVFRKIWSPKNFKAHISPHEVMQVISSASLGKFKITEQSDPINFLSWFFNTIHQYLCLKFQKRESIISQAFQGELVVETFTILKESDTVGFNEEVVSIDGVSYRYEIKPQKFYFLTFELPNSPLFKDSNEKINIPQVSIYELMKKYNGTKFTDDPIRGIKRRYTIKKLPDNLILFYRRFEKNKFFIEKNPTIVNFPLKDLSFEDVLHSDLKEKYSLTANIIHDGKPDTGGTYRVQVRHKGLDAWFDIQDLNVVQTIGQSVAVSESYIHFYEKRQSL